MKRQPRLSDPVTGALIDQETGVVTGYLTPFAALRAACEDYAEDVRSATGVALKICDAEADDD